jgi:hypothetical protein
MPRRGQSETRKSCDTLHAGGENYHKAIDLQNYTKKLHCKGAADTRPPILLIFILEPELAHMN